MEFKDKCITTTTNKRIVFKENRSKLTILNEEQKELSKIIIDDCQITDELRCDFILLEDDKENYIELKGHDLNYAIKQIKSTIQKLSDDSRRYPKRSFIICTRVTMTSTGIQNLQHEFRRKFDSDLIVKSTPYEYKL